MTPSTTNFAKADLVLVRFPHTSSGHAAVRPALVILDTGDADVLLARVTTQRHATPFDVPVADWANAGLLGPSVVRLHKLATLENALVQRRLGGLQPPDRAAVAAVLGRAFGSW